MPDQRIFELTEQPSLDNDAWLIMDKSGWQTARKIAPSLVSGGGGSTLPVADTQTIVKGSADGTKLLRFEVDGFTAGATRVMTPPDSDIILAGTNIDNNFSVSQNITGSGNTYIGVTRSGGKFGSLLSGTTGTTFQYDKTGDFYIHAADSVSDASVDEAFSLTVRGSTTNLTSRFGFNKLAPELTMDAVGIVATTSVITSMLLLGLRSSGTPAANFGTGIHVRLKSSTTNDQDVGRLTWMWATATHATRAARGRLTAYYTSTERECIRWEADSSNPLLGFLGATAIARPSSYTLAGTAGRTLPTPPGAFTGIDNAQAGTVYAQVADLNTLRTTVSDLVGVVRQLIVDLASTSGYGLLQAA